MKKIGWIGFACAIASGCAGTGETVGEHGVAVVGLTEAEDLYSDDGCAQLRASGLELYEVPVLGSGDLVAVVSENVALCVRRVNGLELAGAPGPGFGEELGPFDGPGIPTSETDAEPDPMPADPGGPAQEPDPMPARPTGTGPGPLT